jgi:hypothetical protein
MEIQKRHIIKKLKENHTTKPNTRNKLYKYKGFTEKPGDK